MQNSGKKRIKWWILLAAVILVLGLTACAPKEPEPVSETELLLNTVVTVTLYGGGDEELLRQCMDECRRYEKIFSRTDPESELYALNEAGTMEVSEELLSLLKTALYYCELSGGAFDITMGGVSDLYAFSSERPRVPGEEELAEALSHVDYKNIQIDGSTVTLLDPAAVIDLGAIAKGYIADRLAQFLLDNGQASATIDLGGNVYCVGSKPDGSDFKVGIQCPFEDRTQIIGAVAVSGMSVVTSGVYERYFEENGAFYHHILDPETGLPCANGLLAVSIVSERSVDGDALSTLCFALGMEDGMALIDSMDGVYAVFVTEDFVPYPSRGFEEMFQPVG